MFCAVHNSSSVSAFLRHGGLGQISMLCGGPSAVKLVTLLINVAFSVHMSACAYWRVKVRTCVQFEWRNASTNIVMTLGKA